MSLRKDNSPGPHPDPLVASVMRAAADAPAEGCPEPELLGRFAEDGAGHIGGMAIEAHVHGCARCQAIVAACVRALPESRLDTTVVAGEASGSWFGSSLISWRWLVPVTSVAAVAMVAVWIGRGPSAGVSQQARVAVERPDAPVEAPSAPEPFAPDPRKERDSGVAGEGARTLRAAPEAAVEGRVAPTHAAADAATSAAARGVGPSSTAGRRARLDEAAATPAPAEQNVPLANLEARAKAAPARDERQMADPAATGRAVPGSPRLMREQAVAPPPEVSETSSVDALTRNELGKVTASFASVIPWRVRDGVVERSRDRGQTWLAAAAPPRVRVVAVSSPSLDVCWAVGASDVIRTIDGVTWAQTTSPTSDRLSGVAATSAVNAVVTTASGVRFATSDGGITWRRVP